jgi:ferredoxin-type protein NapH
MKILKKYKPSITFFFIFEAIALGLWLGLNNIFYLFNFSYIGISLSIALALYIHRYKHARLAAQLMVGSYMLFYLGLFQRENMQIEGFWYYLFTGTFEAATIHYAVAKIFGPVFFGRGWCGYACWTGMVLDLLPYKIPKNPERNLRSLRYLIFFLSLVFVSSLFFFKIPDLEQIMFLSFIVGNLLYYISGIALAFLLKDNRAFCKYLCPITIFLKPASYFARLRIQCDTQKCVSCKTCSRVCPMNVEMTDNSRRRRNGTECILCMNCIESCPKKALYL